MLTRKMLAALLAAVLLAFTAVPLSASAASIEFTATVKSSLDKTIAKADSGQADKLNARYDELLRLLQQDDELDTQIKNQHTINTEQAAAIAKQIKLIDSEKLNKLKADLEERKEKYKPLFASYTDLNKQIEQARQLKNKPLTEMLRFQASIVKLAVQAARAEIKAKEEPWQTAKANNAKLVKKIKGKLDDADPIKEQIKAKQGAIQIAERGLSPLWSTFKQVAKQGDVHSTLDTLSSLVSLSGQINDEKQKIVTLETKVRDIHAAAKALIP